MNLRLCIAAAAVALVAPRVDAQIVNATVGPNPAPIGCPVSITFSNDWPGSASSSGCSWRVYDSSQQLVFDPNCPGNPVLIGPWGWVGSDWNQKDQSGQQVAPGNYWVEVMFEAGLGVDHFVPLTVGGTEAGLVLQGSATLGQTITNDTKDFYLCSPNDPGEPYLLLAAFSDDAGFETCAGPFPLDLDSLLLLSLQANAVFPASFGTLGPTGRSEAPQFAPPNSPNLVGLELATAFVVLDLDGECPIRRISTPYSFTIQ